MDIYLGLISAQALRAENPKAANAESSMHGGIPRGNGYYHVNVSLFDSKTKAPITDAQVKATLSDPVMGGETKALQPMAIPNAMSYGNYSRVAGTMPRTITVSIKRASAPLPTTANFAFER